MPTWTALHTLVSAVKDCVIIDAARHRTNRLCPAGVLAMFQTFVLLLCCPLQLNDLKRLLLDKDTVLQEYEYERGQMQRRMEELGQRLADKSSSLEGSRSVSDCWHGRTASWVVMACST